MKRISSLMNFAVLFSLFSLGSQAHATAWVDFSPTGGDIDIAFDIDDPDIPGVTELTILRRVTLTCPKDGHLVATGTSNFETETVGDNNPIIIRYDITQDKAESSFDTAYEVVIDVHEEIFEQEPPSTRPVLIPHSWNLPGSIQRTFTCKKGKKHTFYFVASARRAGEPLPGMAKAHHPNLVVEFFDKRL
jgi:hypothetical protein